MNQSELIATDIEAYLKQHEHKELLRFLTCGSVDDGKSTLIGRLLYDSKMVYEDQLAAVQVDSKRFGTTGGNFDPALLTDGLRAEREQGITIDVAYRYFSTTRRKFIIADTPGHEQYTRNMATGASTCNLAIILIDARHGVQVQTRRHSFIVSLLGIKHVIVAINKMDLVDYSEEQYEKIKADYLAFTARLDLPDVAFVPLSALTGENVVNRSENMDWYTGSTVMHLLEHTPIVSDRNLIDLRFPVQHVLRPDLDFRGFSGTIASGIVRPGDEIMSLPSRKTSKVERIVTRDGDLDEAIAGQSVTLTLEDEIDCSRGDMLVHPGNQPTVDQSFEAMVVWMTDAPLKPGASYILKHTTRASPAMVSNIRYRMDVNELHRHDADQLELNEIGRIEIETAQPLTYDPYKKNRQTGAFILIDRLTHSTVGAGMILDRGLHGGSSLRARLHEKTGTQADQHESLVTDEQRAQRLGHNPATVWLTGLTGSGKSPIAYALEKRLFDEGLTPFVLDGRNARLGISADLTFSAADRRENLRRAAEVAKMMNNAGLICICAFLSPSAEDRAEARRIIGEDKFVEVFADAPESAAKERAADQGSNMKAYSDIAAPYEMPESPDVTLKTADTSVEQCVETLLAALKQRGAMK